MDVLIADDEPGTRLLLAAAVQRLGHHATEAADGAEAWERLRGGAHDVVISDWEMPGLDGTELIRRVRAQAGASYRYLIVLTGRADQAAARETMLAGADDLLLKPLDPVDLERRLIAAERVVALHRRLAADAGRDALTGLPDRRRLEQDAATLVARSTRSGVPAAAVALGLDGLDPLTGDEADDLLRRAAPVLRRALADGEGLYRAADRELALLCAEGSLAAGRGAVERLRTALAEAALLLPDGRRATLSAGLAVLRAQGDARELLDDAAGALERLRAQGATGTAAHDPHAPTARAGRPIRVLVADDDPAALELLAAIAERDPGLELVGRACDGPEAVARAVDARPDVVLLDVDMPGSGARAATQIRDRLPGARIVGYSASDAVDSQVAMLRAGAVGYVVKGAAPSEIVRSVVSACRW